MSRVDVKKEVKPQKISAPSIPVVLELLEELWKQGTESAKIVYDEPLDGLIETVLSQNTNDRNRDMAFERLTRCGTWPQIAQLPQEKIVEAIKPAGLCNNKSMTIMRVLRQVKKRFGEYSLKSLKKGTPKEAWEFMTSIQGVGPKTAACVLAFDLGFPAFPVDTHVARISKRLGWAEEKETPAQIQARLEDLVPDELKTAGHLNMIQHGKNICKARAPKCGQCPLRGICPSSTQ
ncbi:MAG: endonuclease III domain-containing protein [Pyramidobacter sp.]|jgi:endonuclease-3